MREFNFRRRYRCLHQTPRRSSRFESPGETIVSIPEDETIERSFPLYFSFSLYLYLSFTLFFSLSHTHNSFSFFLCPLSSVPDSEGRHVDCLRLKKMSGLTYAGNVSLLEILQFHERQGRALVNRAIRPTKRITFYDSANIVLVTQ